jgi:hypothetical protein
MALQRVLKTAQYITGAELPAIQDIYIRRCGRETRKTVKDSNHPSHRLFSLLSNGKRYRCIKFDINRLLKSFDTQSVRLIYSYKDYMS